MRSTPAMLSKPKLSSSAGSRLDASMFEIQQVPDGVAVLGAVQAVRRLVAERDRGGCLTIERALERGDEGLERGRVGPRHALRRHHAAVELLQHLLPQAAVEDAAPTGSASCSDSPPVFSRSLWQLTQYFWTSARSGSAGTGAVVDERTGAGAVCRAAAADADGDGRGLSRAASVSGRAADADREHGKNCHQERVSAHPPSPSATLQAWHKLTTPAVPRAGQDHLL